LSLPFWLSSRRDLLLHLQLLLQLLLQLQLQSLFVLAVILSAAKDPETFHPSKPIGPFNHILHRRSFTDTHYQFRTPSKTNNPQTPANQTLFPWPQKC
jgi:hypothetical protein